MKNKAIKTALCLITLIGAITTRSTFAATTFEDDLAKLKTKWALKHAKEQLKAKQLVEKEKLKRAQKIEQLNLELGANTSTAKTK